MGPNEGKKWVSGAKVGENASQPTFDPLMSGTAKGGWPWRGSVKILTGFFPGFLIKKPGKSPVKTRLKPGKNLLENVESTQKVGDLVVS